MTRFEAQVWQPERFYPVKFGTDVIDELLEMPAELKPILEDFDRYEQLKRNIDLKPFVFARANMQREIDEFETMYSSSPQRPPQSSQPLYEFARFRNGVRGVTAGLGTPAVHTVRGHNRGSKYVFAELDRAGVPDIEHGALLVPPSYVRLAPYILRRAGLCYPAAERGE